MCVLLDEQLDWRLARAFSRDHHVRSVNEMGWAGLTNGELLQAAEGDFDVLVTLDRNIEFQQPLTRYALAVLIVVAPSNRIVDTQPLVPQIEELIAQGLDPGRAYLVMGPTRG